MDVTTPQKATRSFLERVSYAYRVADSEVASATATPAESVRVDSYIQLNRQNGRLLDQKLVAFEVRRAESHGTTAAVAASEDWRYRYIGLSDGLYSGPEHRVTYDTTYTLVKGDAGWLVDSVAAKPRTRVE